MDVSYASSLKAETHLAHHAANSCAWLTCFKDAKIIECDEHGKPVTTTTTTTSTSTLTTTTTFTTTTVTTTVTTTTTSLQAAQIGYTFPAKKCFQFFLIVKPFPVFHGLTACVHGSFLYRTIWMIWMIWMLMKSHDIPRHLIYLVVMMELKSLLGVSRYPYSLYMLHIPYINIFPVQWRAKELLGVSQPSTLR